VTTLVLVGALLLWFIASVNARGTTVLVFDVIGVDVSTPADAVLAAFTVFLVVLCCTVGVVVFNALVQSVLRFRQDRVLRGVTAATHPEWMYRTLAWATGFALGAMLAVAAVAAVALAAVASWLTMAAITREAAKAARDGVQAAIGAASDASSRLLAELDVLAAELRGLSEGQRASVGAALAGILGSLGLGAGGDLSELAPAQAPPRACLPGCLDLGQLWFLDAEGCVCDPEELDEMEALADQAVRELAEAAVGSFLIVVSCAVLLASVTHGCMAAREARRLAFPPGGGAPATAAPPPTQAASGDNEGSTRRAGEPSAPRPA